VGRAHTHTRGGGTGRRDGGGPFPGRVAVVVVVGGNRPTFGVTGPAAAAATGRQVRPDETKNEQRLHNERHGIGQRFYRFPVFETI